jgi:hypothetical protein
VAVSPEIEQIPIDNTSSVSKTQSGFVKVENLRFDLFWRYRNSKGKKRNT